MTQQNDTGLQPDTEFKPLFELVKLKQQKHGEKYDRFIVAVIELLRHEFPNVFGNMPGQNLAQMVSFADVIGEDSQRMMKRLQEACAGCGWCCSQTAGVIVTAEDAERISRKLKIKKTDYFAVNDGVWMIKKAHPCQWWNPRNGRCQIYNIRPQTCRTWPTLPNEKGQSCLQPVAECAYAVRVTAVKVLESLRKSEQEKMVQTGQPVK